MSECAAVRGAGYLANISRNGHLLFKVRGERLLPLHRRSWWGDGTVLVWLSSILLGRVLCHREKKGNAVICQQIIVLVM